MSRRLITFSPLVLVLMMLLSTGVVQAATASPGDPQAQGPSAIAAAASARCPCVPQPLSSAFVRSGRGPLITKLSPAAGKPNAKVTVSGRRFGSKRGRSYVTFGSFKCTSYVRWSATTIVCRVPAKAAGAGTVNVRVKTAAGLSNRKAFRVTGAVTPGTLAEETDARLRFLGQWSSYSNPSCSGGTHKVVDQPGAAIVDFTGTEVYVIAGKGPVYGIMRVWLDGIAQPDVDLYAKAAVYRRPVYRKTGLADAAHRLVLDWAGRKNPSASSTAIGFDAVGVVGSLTQVPDMTGGLVGFWAATPEPNWSESYRFRADGSYTYLVEGLIGSTYGLLRQEGLYVAYQAQTSVRMYLFDRRERFTPQGGPDGAWHPLDGADWAYVITRYSNATKLNISNGWTADYWLQ